MELRRIPLPPFYNDKDIYDALPDPDEDEDGTTPLPLIRSRALTSLPWLSAGVTTTSGGVSGRYFCSLNLALNSADSIQNVEENYDRVLKRFHSDYDSLVIMNQVHGSHVEGVDRDMASGRGFACMVGSTDGIFTSVPGLLLSVRTADCVPILLADTEKRTVCALHSGWRGTAGKIGAEAIRKMGSDPRNITAVIGPSISVNHYEVTNDVTDIFRSSFTPEEMEHIAYPSDDNHCLLDLWAACHTYLKNAGVLEKHIHFSGLCTWENHHLFFSHRYTSGKRGLFGSFIKIN